MLELLSKHNGRRYKEYLSKSDKYTSGETPFKSFLVDVFLSESDKYTGDKWKSIFIHINKYLLSNKSYRSNKLSKPTKLI